MAGVSGRKLDETYRLAWLRGLKTTYYLRTLGATQAEKSTSRSGRLNAVPSGDQAEIREAAGPVCALRPGDPGFSDCEACQ
jgi:ribonucleoside-diphosphate reductase alpha chain